MRLAERVEEIRTALELFPRCVECGGDLTDERWSNLTTVRGRRNRFAHHICPERETANAAD